MSLFEQGYRQLARALIGRKLVYDGMAEVEITKAQGYSRKENESPLYEPLLTMKPGEVYCPRYRGAILILIACLDGDESGGCVLLRAVKLGEAVRKGPAAVAIALSVTDHKTRGRIIELRDKLVLDM